MRDARWALALSALDEAPAAQNLRLLVGRGTIQLGAKSPVRVDRIEVCSSARGSDQ